MNPRVVIDAPTSKNLLMSDITTTDEIQSKSQERPGDAAKPVYERDEMGARKSTTRIGRNYSAFDADLTHQALNVKMFGRLLKWTKPYKNTLAIAGVLVFVSSLLQLLGPIIQHRVVVDMVLFPGQTAHDRMPDYGLIDLAEWLMSMMPFHPLAIAMMLFFGVFVLQMFMRIAMNLLLTSGTLKALRDLRVDLFASLERKPASFYDHVAVGRVMTRVVSDIDNLFNLLTSFIQHAGDVVMFVILLFILIDMSASLTGVALFVIPLAAIATYLFRIAMREIFRLVRDSMSALNQYMNEDLMGIEVVQLSGREEHNFNEYQDLNKENRKQEFRAINYEVVFETFNMSLSSIATAAIIWFGGGQVVQEQITLGVLILFSSYLNMLIAPIQAVGQLFSVLFRAMASGERIFQALDWDERLHEPTDPVKLAPRLSGRIDYKNLNFTYPGSEDQVLRDVSFHIEPGEKLAIVGPTGSGKSTIIRLLARFYDIDDDQIFVDGVDVNRIASKDLRERVGVVLQDFHIFSGSVLENITLNNPEISKERAIHAAKIVNASSFIESFPDGYDTQLSERGHNLSQGQQQLLAFARVLAADTEILVLDEATSSIDTGTELIIQEALHRLTEGRTSIIIAHRLQTIQECDRILVLHHGEIQEIGTHEELLEHKGIYYTLHELQFQDTDTAAQFLEDRKDRDRKDERLEWEKQLADQRLSGFFATGTDPNEGVPPVA